MQEIQKVALPLITDEGTSTIRLIVHVRERERILNLVSVLMRKQELVRPQSELSDLWLNSLKQDC
jgi:hypothetical protein